MLGRTTRAALAVVLFTLAVPAAAQAGNLFIEHGRLVFVATAVAARAEANSLDTISDGTDIFFQDTAVPLQIGPGCTRIDPGKARCPLSAVRVLNVDAGPKDDLVTILFTYPVPASVNGGDGNDFLTGANEDDTLSGGPGNDTLSGRGGRDSLSGGDGDDRLDNDLGPTIFDGGAGRDTASYGNTSTRVFVTLDGIANDGSDANGDGAADEADNVLPSVENVIGTSLDDTIIGGDESNVFEGANGNDTLQGLGGDDRFVSGPGADTFGGGTGVDTADYTIEALPLTITLDGVANDGQSGEGDNAGGGGMENVIGGSGDDHITGNAGANKLTGGHGSDVISGLDGNDDIEANDGVTDAVDCGAGTDFAKADLQDTGFTGCETIDQAPLHDHPTVKITPIAHLIGTDVIVHLHCPRALRHGCKGTLALARGGQADLGGKLVATRRYGGIRRGRGHDVAVHVPASVLSRLRELGLFKGRVHLYARALEKAADGRPKRTYEKLRVKRPR